MSTDDTREALAAMVREGKAAGMYADDHGAAGFCTDHAQPAPDERVETVARVLREHCAVDHLAHEWACVCGHPLPATGPFDEPLATRLHRHQAAAVVAALDDETARLRGSADAWWTEYDRELTAHGATKAEVERLTRIIDGYDRTPAEQRAADAEAERDALAATAARVEALIPSRMVRLVFADEIRAALHPTVTDTPTEGGAR